MEIDKYITERWSPRAFSDQTIAHEDLTALFSAAGRAPSANNEQPWRFMVGQKGDDTYGRIFETLVDFNKAWCKTAPVLVAAIVKEESEKTNTKNAHAEYDLGAAVAHLSMKAFDKNLFVHQAAGFDAQQCNELLNIPDGYRTVTIFAIGYIGDKNQLHEKIAALENGVSSRNDLSQFVFNADWNRAFFS